MHGAVRLQRHRGLDPGRLRVDDRRAGEHVRLVDAAAELGPCGGELDPRVDAFRLGRVGRAVHGDRLAVSRRAAAPRRSGRARPARSRARAARAPARARRPGRRRSTSSTSVSSSCSGVASAASTIARSDPLSSRTIRPYARRSGGSNESTVAAAACARCASTRPCEQRRRQERRVPGEDEHLVRVADRGPRAGGRRRRCRAARPGSRPATPRTRPRSRARRRRRAAAARAGARPRAPSRRAGGRAADADASASPSASGFRGLRPSRRLRVCAGSWSAEDGWGARIRTWDHGTKTRCLTTWPRPSVRTASIGRVTGGRRRGRRARAPR